MAITLGGVSLPDVIIEREFEQAGVRSIVEFSLGGRPIIWEDEKFGQEMDLVGGGDFAWITRQTLINLQSLANVPSATYDLVYEANTFTVRFRQEDPPVITADPVVPRPNQALTDEYSNLRIKLMLIEPYSSISESSESSSSESSQPSSSSSDASPSSSSESSESFPSNSSESSESSSSESSQSSESSVSSPSSSSESVSISSSESSGSFSSSDSSSSSFSESSFSQSSGSSASSDSSESSESSSSESIP